MLKVGLNIYPLQSAHKNRGIGFYVKNLLENFKKRDDIEVVEFTNLNSLKGAEVIHYPWFDFFFNSLPFFKKFPTVVTVHDTIPLIFKEKYPVGVRGRLNFLRQKLSLKKSKYIITDSHSSKKDLEKYLKINPNKIVVIPLSAGKEFKVIKDVEKLRIQKRFNLPERFILYVGDVNYSKNLPILIYGFNEIVNKKEFNNLKLALVGGAFLKKVDSIDHPELESLKEVNRLIKELNLESSIIRSGQIDIDDLVGFYNLATLYVQPSLYEGFGLPILQAMACGTPVLSSNASSLPEVGGNAVVYFNPNELDSLVSALYDTLQDYSLRNKLSELGRKQAERFSFEKAADQTIEVYQRAKK